MRRWLFAVVPLLYSSIALGQGGGGGVESLWQNNCAKCHGKSGQGGGAGTRTLLTDALRDQKFDRPFFDATKNGQPDQGMPAFGETLSDKQIWAMVVYIRELQQRAYRDGGGAPKSDGGVLSAKEHKYKIETVVKSGLDVPWAVDFLPDDSMLITERPGTLRIFADAKLSTPIKGTPTVRNRGQGGMMDVAVHPDYAKNGWVYLAFADPKERNGNDDALGMTKVIRGKIKDAKWTQQQTIFEADPKHYLPTDIHFGCKLVFSPPTPGPDGNRYLYFGIGERGREELAQDRTRPNGKIYRVWDDGKVPTDNPFVDEKDAYKAIWSFGHRNPQGLTLDLNGDLWDTEHGPRGGDEVNRIEKARNYGWPIVSFGINYSGAPYKLPWVQGTENIAMPAFRWLPSIGASGLDVARGPAFPKWKGDLLAGGLSGANVDRIRMKDGQLVEREELIYGMGRVRDVACGPDGTIYVVLNDPDKIIKLVPAD